MNEFQKRYGGLQPKPTIFCLINWKNSEGEVNVVALAEDGEALAGHFCSHRRFAWGDITHPTKHEKYKTHYPKGYRLEWVTEEVILSKSNPRFERAVERNQHEKV